MQGYAEPLGYQFLVDEFGEFHLRHFARLVGSGVLLVSSPTSDSLRARNAKGHNGHIALVAFMADLNCTTR
jgi:hypothetical protein